MNSKENGVRRRYNFVGAVHVYDNLVCSNFRATTVAETEAKAKNNFKFQYRKANNLATFVPIKLSGKIEAVQQ